MIYPPSAQLLLPVVPGATKRKYRPLPLQPLQSHDRNGISSLGLSYTDRSAQRTNGSSTKASKLERDIVGVRLLSESENISNHIPSNGIIISSY